MKLSKPRGLLIHDQRKALMVADSGNHRVAVFDLDSFQLLDSLGADILQEPWAIACDADGSIYVADHGSNAVIKFLISGDVDATFWPNVKASGLIKRPGAVTVHSQSVYILDLGAKSVFEFDANGKPVLDISGEPCAASWTGFQQPMGLAVGGHLWAGDNGSGSVTQFNLKSGQFHAVGQALGYQGPVAALAVDPRGGLWIAGGGAPAPVRLTIDAGYGSKGAMWSEPISIQGPSPSWHRVQAIAQLAGESSIQLFLHASDVATPPPIYLAANPPFAGPDCRTVPYNVTDAFIGGPRTRKYLWVAAISRRNDGTATTVISQMRAEYNHVSYLEKSSRDLSARRLRATIFLLRFSTLFESFFDEPEASIAALPFAFRSTGPPSRASCLGLRLGLRSICRRISPTTSGARQSRVRSRVMPCAARRKASSKRSRHRLESRLRSRSRFSTRRGGACPVRRRPAPRASRRGPTERIQCWGSPPVSHPPSRRERLRV